jgi:hypothetical protein
VGYAELEGTNRDIAQTILKQVLDHEDIVPMIVIGLDHNEIAAKAKEVADQEPNTWWVVWAQNPNLLTDEQIEKFTANDLKNVVCVISPKGNFIKRLQAENAGYKGQLLAAFLEAESAE